MQLNHSNFGPSALRAKSATSSIGCTWAKSQARRQIVVKNITCKATSHGDKVNKVKKTFTPKVNALLLAALPLVTALPAGANEIQHYLSLATPGLAVVIGSLAYAIASPPAVRKRLFTSQKPVDDVALDLILKTEYHPCPGAAPAIPKLEELIEEMGPSAITEPAAVAALASSPDAADAQLVAEVLAESDVLASVSHLQQKTLAAENKGRTLSMAFTGDQGRTGSLTHGAVASNGKATPDKAEASPETQNAQSQDSVEKAKEIVSYVMEWTGLDAHEKKQAIRDSSVQSNVVPLHKSAENPVKELVSAIAAKRVDSNSGNNGASEAEMATVAVVATIPTSAVAALTTDTSSKSSSQLQAEHREKIDSLMSQVASIKAVAVAPALPSTNSAPSESRQKDYDAKVTALKHSAAHKQMEESNRWHQQKASLESKMNQATRDRLQAVKPYSALSTTNKPQGLAKLHPKALVATFVETMMSMWRFFVNTARRFVGQDPPASPQMQA